MQILNGELQRADMTQNARGGTELMVERLIRDVDPDLLKDFQIIVSRLEHELDPDKHRIYWCHDLPNDPASEHLANGGWEKFHRIVFVSNWQMQQYIARFNIPWERCFVLQNAIEPIENHEKPDDVINIAYWSTPHRGLDLLFSVFCHLVDQKPDLNIKLHVFSSFELYGWKQRDEQFEQLFKRIKEHPKCEYYGSLPNEEVRDHLKDMHILGYPSTWPETSCLVLMEAMSARIVPIHSNFAALPETAANWTWMYQYSDDKNLHAQQFHSYLSHVIDNYYTEQMHEQLDSAKSYTDVFYNWNLRAANWDGFLRAVKAMPLESAKIATGPKRTARGSDIYEVGP